MIEQKRELAQTGQTGGLELPPGNFQFEMVGSFQNQIEANRRLAIIIPLVLLLNIFCTDATVSKGPAPS